MLYRTRIAVLLTILICECLWAVAARAACPQGIVSHEVVSYGVSHRTEACVLALRISGGVVRVTSAGDGIYKAGFER